MTDLAQRRIQCVLDHMALEIPHDWDAVIATFDGHPRYELYGTGTVFDGEEEVRNYFNLSRIPFPDQANEVIAIAHGDNTVLVEFWLTGTHLGRLKIGDEVIEPTGKAFRMRMAASFEFAPGKDKILCERPYFDQTLIAKQLGLA